MSYIRKSDFVIQDGPFRSVDDDAIGRLASELKAQRLVEARAARRAARPSRFALSGLIRIAQTPITLSARRSSAVL